MSIADHVVILEVGTEGGSLELWGQQTEDRWTFQLQLTDQTPLLIDECEISAVLGPVGSFDAAVALLDRYAWQRMYPVEVHPAFRKEILAAVQSRLDRADPRTNTRLTRWIEICTEEYGSPNLEVTSCVDSIDFAHRVHHEFLPAFCLHYGIKSFDFSEKSLAKISHVDVKQFLSALANGVVSIEGAFFRAPRSGAKEMIFWTGSKDAVTRPISLWIEPVITIGGAGVLANRHKWPVDRIGLQSRGNWAFDLVAYADSDSVYIACEVKKSIREIDAMIDNMQTFLAMKPLNDEPSHIGQRNSYRKVAGLRHFEPKLFWALGPAGYQKVFRVSLSSKDDGTGTLEEVDINSLDFPATNSAATSY